MDMDTNILKYKIRFSIMMVHCIKQHLSNIWNSIHEKVRQHWGSFKKKLSLYKKSVYICFNFSKLTSKSHKYEMNKKIAARGMGTQEHKRRYYHIEHARARRRRATMAQATSREPREHFEHKTRREPEHVGHKARGTWRHTGHVIKQT